MIFIKLSKRLGINTAYGTWVVSLSQKIIKVCINISKVYISLSSLVNSIFKLFLLQFKFVSYHRVRKPKRHVTVEMTKPILQP